MFAKQWMPPVPGAFILSPSNCPGASQVAYFSAGIPFEFPQKEWLRIQTIFEESSFIYLRDEQSATKLRNAGVQRDLVVAPDVVVVISDLYPKASLRATADRLLAKVDLSSTQPYLCYQTSAATTQALPIISHELREFFNRQKIPIVLLPLGFCHGDRETLSHLASLLPDQAKLVNPVTVIDMLAILAHADMFAGISMHGNICAYSYGVPHLFGPLGVDKIVGAMCSMDLNADHRISNWRELSQSLEVIANMDRAALAAKQTRAKTRTYEASNGLIASLT